MILGASEILWSLLALLIILYYYLMGTYNFWKSRDVPGPKPIPFFGTIKDIILSKHSITTYVKEVYDQYPNEPMVGFYIRRDPVLLLNDMEMIKTVLIKDFRCFMDRGMEMHEKHEPLTAHLFNLEAKRWRPLRTKLTPVFTSGKLKQMFYLLVECADQLDNYLDKVNGNAVDIRDLSAKFTTDVIGVCAFGLQANALASEDSKFREMGRRIFDTNFRNTLRFRVRSFVPPLFEIIGKWLVDNEVTEFFINLMKDTMEYRKNNNVIRHDFIDLLSAIRDEPDKIEGIEMTDPFVAAQLFVFFVAGFETSSSTMSNCLYELAMNHKIRDKLQLEISEELEKANGVITYEGIKNMKYLDQVFNETLRKYPPVTVTMRKTTAPYTFTDTKVSLPVGTKVWIPHFAIQRDPKYYPDPDVFDPERFSDEAIKSRPAMAFLAFGDGPRNCIGERFGQMQTKVGIVKVLQNYTVDICDETVKKYKISPHTFLLSPDHKIIVKILKK